MSRPPPKPSFVWTGFTGGVSALAVVQKNGRSCIAVGTKNGRIELYDEATRLLVSELYEDSESRSIVAIGEFNGEIVAHVRCFAIIRFTDSANRFEILTTTSHYGHAAASFMGSLLAIPDLENKTNVVQLLKENEAESKRIKFNGESSAVMCLSVTEEFLFIGWDNGYVEQRSIEIGEKLTSQKLYDDPIFAMCSTSSTLFVASSKPPIKVLKIIEGQLVDDVIINYVSSASGCSSLRLTPSTKTLFASFWDGSLRAWTTKKKALLLVVQVCEGLPVQSLCSPTNTKLYTGDDQDRVFLWNF